MTLEGYPKVTALNDGTQVIIRPMTSNDGKALLEFFRALPEEDRLFLRDDVTNPQVVERFVTQIDYDSVLPLLAEYEGKIVGDATLHRSKYGWSTHVGEIRMVVSRGFQRRGLGTALARLLVRHAISVGLDKMVAQIVDNQIGAQKAFERLGFHKEAVLKGHVKDIHGHKRDLVIMANDVSHIWQTMESLVEDWKVQGG